MRPVLISSVLTVLVSVRPAVPCAVVPSAVLSALSLVALALGAPAAARDLATMTADEVTALQYRLSDAGCYRGPLDGLAGKAVETAVKACPDQDPVLRIETAMHTAVVWRVAVDAACTTMATASEDKTVRVWSLPDGRLKRTVRLPIGDTDGGKARAVTLSPDGRWLVAGGWDAFPTSDAIYVTDLVGGRTQRFGTFENVVKHLAFSRDGGRIAVALGAGKGIRVLDRATGRELAADRDYGADVYGVVFAPDGALLATGYDGFVRRYGPDGRRTAKVKAPHGSEPYTIDVDPTGRRAAIGYADTNAVSILDARTLAAVAKADTGDITDDTLGRTVWRRDGRLLAGGQASRPDDKGAERYFFRVFDDTGRRLTDVPVAADTILDAKACGDGVAYVTGEPSFGLIDARDGVTVLHDPVTADMRVKRDDGFLVSADGATLRFGLGVGAASPVSFDLPAATLTDAPTVPAGVTRPAIEGLKVENWINETRPTLNGKPIGLDSHEIARSLAIRPARDGFVLGADWSLRAVAASGTERWAIPVPAAAWGVNLARDGDLVVAALGDGTVRWYRWTDGQELLALFIHRQDRRWVAWTPSGYYMASAGGEDLIGWHINRGWEQAPDFFPASRFRDRFSRPDVVQRVLVTLDEDKAVAEANALSRRREEQRPMPSRLPPVIRIAAPADGARFTGAAIDVDLDLRSPSGLPLTGLDILIDGRPVAETRGLGRDDLTATVSGCLDGANRGGADGGGRSGGEGAPCRLSIPVPGRDVQVSVIARAGAVVGEAATLRLAYAGRAAGVDEAAKPKLYVLAIGVADYADSRLKLGLAGKDARDFAAMIAGQSGGLYRDVVVKQLIDREATRDAVAESFSWLEKQVTSRDVAMVFLAGHGVTDERQRFFFLPADANADSPQVRGVAKDMIMDTLKSLAGKAVLFLDSCHAGGVTRPGVATRGAVDVNGLVNELTSSENGVVVFAAAQGRELSQENPAWGNGAFTKAVLEGIGDGRAEAFAKGAITLSGLDAYVAERVKDLTGGQQHPAMSKPSSVPNFAIAVKR
jgi:WD40 repeat protein